jgi:glucosyl-dolichyl phosphate glucuronosyltransferase
VEGLASWPAQEPSLTHLLGIPRCRMGRALRGLTSFPRHLFLTRDTGQALADELPSWHLPGHIHERHSLRIEGYQAMR